MGSGGSPNRGEGTSLPGSGGIAGAAAGPSGGAGARFEGGSGVPGAGRSTGGSSNGGPGGAAGRATVGGSSGAGFGGTGASGAPFSPPFILGADISSVQESNATFRDTDGQTKGILPLLKNHGFNFIRLKTFVDPMAPYGYASSANGCVGLQEAFGDRDHVVAFGTQIKAAGLGFLLDFHYSDVWADPGNQIVPQRWRSASSIAQLAALLKAYTKDVITTAVQAGARPDMVQIGNEITPGMLMHLPGPNTDCWGNNPVPAPVGGSASNWDNLATLLTAGIEAVREVDARIQILLHLENTDDLAGVRRWVDSARSRNVDFDILGLSCYTEFQGQPSVWQETFDDLAGRYPDLQLIVAEYNLERTQANRMIKNLPAGRGLGTFFWEPTRSGEWGPSIFSFQGNLGIANPQDFAEYDALRVELGL